MTLARVATENARAGIDVNRMRDARKSIKAIALNQRTTRPKHPQLGQPIDWSQITSDKNGKPLISFTPRPESRRTILMLITSDQRKLGPKAKALRVELLKKLRGEFIRIYTRYRRAVLREKGKTDSYYEVHKKEIKYAEAAAIACLQKSVTPAQVLNYWHRKIRSFANNNMDVPPLNMLSNPSVIDEVSINLSMAGRDCSGLDESDVESWKPPKRKTMWLGDSSTLHPRLRRDLMENGFDLSKYNDSDLSTIQDYAIDVKSGSVGIKLVPEALRPMIKWALLNTLKECDPKDFAYRG